MRRLLLLYRSMLGKKAIVAVTGAILLGFLLLLLATIGLAVQAPCLR